MSEDEETRTVHLPTEGLTRATFDGLTLRTGTGEPPILEGHGAVFNQWTRIESAIEGRFMERVMPGSFTKSLAESTPKILFQHGQDPTLGDQILASTEAVGEDETGLFYRGELFEGVPPLVVAGLKRGVYGSSFRFSVVRGKDAVPAKRDSRGNHPAYNPEGLPERTIREVKLMEMGPVTWPVYPGADAGVRSLTDRFALQRLTSDPEHLEELVEELPTDTAEQPQVTPEPAPTQVTPEPAPTDATPEVVESIPTPITTESNMAALQPEERTSRLEELRSSIERTATSYTGVLPTDVEVTYETEKSELAQLEKDESAFQARKADLARIKNPESRSEKSSWEDRNVIRKPENIYGAAALQDIESRGRTLDERNALRRDYAMRGLEAEKTFTPLADKPKTQDRIAHLLDSVDEPTPNNPDRELARRIMLGGDPVYKRAYNKLLANGGNVNLLTPEEQRGTALAMNVTTTGGFLVPYAWDPTVIAIGVHNSINPYRQACKVVDVVGANVWHGLTSTAVVAVRGIEALVAAEAGPTFAQPAFTPSRVETQVTYSYEVAQDRANLGEELATLIQEAKDNEEEATFSVGTGATTMLNCVGMVAPKSTVGGWTLAETAAPTAITEADLNSFELALPVRFRRNAAWFLARKTIRYIQALETAYGTVFNAAGSGANPGYPAVGNPDTNDFGNTGLKIKGYPVYESVSIPTTLTAAQAMGAFCDPKTFVIVDRVGMDIEFIPNVFSASQGWMATGQRAIYAMWRNACGPVTILGGLNLTMHT